MAFDADPDIVGIAAQPMWLRWTDAGSGRPVRHAPDYFARRADGTGVLIDVRPDQRIRSRDAAVFAATARSAPRSGGTTCESESSPRCWPRTCAGWPATGTAQRPAAPDHAATRGVRRTDSAAGRRGHSWRSDGDAAGAVRHALAARAGHRVGHRLPGPSDGREAQRVDPTGQRRLAGARGDRVNTPGLSVLAPGDEIRLDGHRYRVVALDGSSLGQPADDPPIDPAESDADPDQARATGGHDGAPLHSAGPGNRVGSTPMAAHLATTATQSEPPQLNAGRPAQVKWHGTPGRPR